MIRFAGGIEKGAKPGIISGGVWMFSFLARNCFHTDTRGFHCRFQGLMVKDMKQLPFRSGGMKLVTEMITLAVISGLADRPGADTHSTLLSKAAFQTENLADGFRHLQYIQTISTLGGKRA